MYPHRIVAALLLVIFSGGLVVAQDVPVKLPPQNVVLIPAIGEGLCLSNLFQSNMVLQRDKPISIWGWASPGQEVLVSIAGQTAKTKAGADRSWQVELAAMPASGAPQTLTVQDASAKLVLENVLLGDVWVLGGQSNMEFPINKVDDGELEIASANFSQIRLLTLPRGKGFESVRSFERLHEWSSWSNRHFSKGDWEVCSPSTVAEFSAIGYVFGRRLHMATQVPIGLIDASIGGTTVETWTPAEVLAQIDGPETRVLMQEWADKIAAFDPQADLATRVAAYHKRIDELKSKGQTPPANLTLPNDLRPGPAADQNRPGFCYASIIRPLEGLAVQGAVFHQGFNNCFNGSAGAKMYYQVFGPMITAWRAAFRDPQLPFCIISLCTAGEPQTLEHFAIRMYDAGSFIREAQYQTFLDLRKAGDQTIGFVSSFDLRKSWYHPQIKIPAGERAAKWALVSRYGLIQGRGSEQYWLAPQIEKMEIVDGTIRLTFSTEVKTKDDSDEKLLGFGIAGNDRCFYPAEVQWYTDGQRDDRNRPQYRRNMLVLRSRFVPEPVHYRYAWARNPLANIVGVGGVPLAAQRSDNWLLEETPLAPLANLSDEAKSNPAAVRNLLLKELELIDKQRRLQEAQATVSELETALEKSRPAPKK